MDLKAVHTKYGHNPLTTQITQPGHNGHLGGSRGRQKSGESDTKRPLQAPHGSTRDLRTVRLIAYRRSLSKHTSCAAPTSKRIIRDSVNPSTRRKKWRECVWNTAICSTGAWPLHRAHCWSRDAGSALPTTLPICYRGVGPPTRDRFCPTSFLSH